ncbi:hypothetical protein DACRYDRAFT_110462 [Dacryopinax primogenitus]|uniref:DUF7770 domain-containing protein n=1 Tax=Dacryopinax primogenitus (strain DJM 731) TaxID=1858805 RepID=M5FQH6_DACPD|nr:uncharacterized protein DACRYDRAFT_110462 [Dacryopinax primogenitus]EJT99145.1 hypothetical protein DACRYDRAFT_110462 [Dacryopinax primogenitus]
MPPPKMGYVDMQNVRAIWQTMRFVPSHIVLGNLGTGCSSMLLYSESVSASFTSPHLPHPTNPNHWYLVLGLSNGLRLRMEIVPSVGTLAIVKVDPLPASFSRTSANPHNGMSLVLELQDPRTTLMDIFHIMITNGLHQYGFTAGGRGHRHWIRTIVYHLEDAGVLEQDSLASVDSIIYQVWWKGTSLGTSPVIPGAFYSCFGCEAAARRFCDHEQTYPWAMSGMRRRQHGFA